MTEDVPVTKTSDNADLRAEQELIERAARALARNAGWGDGEKLVHVNHGPALMINGYSVISNREATPVWRLFANDARVVYDALKLAFPDPEKAIDVWAKSA